MKYLFFVLLSVGTIIGNGNNLTTREKYSKKDTTQVADSNNADDLMDNSNCTRAVHSRADFSGSNLHNVNFSNATMYKCDLSGADLTGAKFKETHLGDAIIDRKWKSYIRKFRVKRFNYIKWK